MQIISIGKSNITKNLNLDSLSSNIAHIDTDEFPDGEIKLNFPDNWQNLMRNQEILLVSNNSLNINKGLMQLMLIAKEAKIAGAKQINVIIPYLGYSRQDKNNQNQSASIVNLMLTIFSDIGINKLYTLDLHSQNIKTPIRIDNISTENIFIPKIKNIDNLMIVSPDIGGVERATKYSKKLNAPIIVMKKYRDNNGICHMDSTDQEAKDKNCIIIDDIISSGGTLCTASDLLMNKGAKSVSAIVTHGVFTQNALSNIENSSLKKLYISNSIKQTLKLPNKIEIVNIDNINL